MVKIKLGNNEKIVTKGAYENFYEHLGYDIVDKDNKSSKREVEKETHKEREPEKKDKDNKDNIIKDLRDSRK